VGLQREKLNGKNPPTEAKKTGLVWKYKSGKSHQLVMVRKISGSERPPGHPRSQVCQRRPQNTVFSPNHQGAPTSDRRLPIQVKGKKATRLREFPGKPHSVIESECVQVIYSGKPGGEEKEEKLGKVCRISESAHTFYSKAALRHSLSEMNKVLSVRRTPKRNSGVMK